MELEWHISEGIGVISINRPHRGNSFTLAMVHEWSQLLSSARLNPEVRVVMLTGTGDKTFCAGIDLDEISQSDLTLTPLQRKSQLHDEIHEVARAVERLDKPLIAALNGAAVGAGLDMALMCDIRLSAASARFAETYIDVGLIPGGGGAYYLSRIVGISKALEMCLTGEFVSSQEALRIGLVNRVFEDEEFRARAWEFAVKIASKPPQTAQFAKRLVRQSSELALDAALELASSHFAVIASTEDAAEALEARRDKRTPRFVGR